MFAFLAGVAAGLLPVVSGPDHLAAVAPIASNRERGQWLTGLQWGIGHTMGVLLIAALLLLLPLATGCAVGTARVWSVSFVLSP